MPKISKINRNTGFPSMKHNMPFWIKTVPLRKILPTANRKSVITVLGSAKKATELTRIASLIGPVAFELSVQVIGERVKRSMSKQIQYSDEPMGEIKLIPDFLPSPAELALKKKNTKITISLSSESVTYFKEAARKHHMQYQKIIRQLLDEYVAHQKSISK